MTDGSRSERSAPPDSPAPDDDTPPAPRNDQDDTGPSSKAVPEEIALETAAENARGMYLSVPRLSIPDGTSSPGDEPASLRPYSDPHSVRAAPSKRRPSAADPHAKDGSREAERPGPDASAEPRSRLRASREPSVDTPEKKGLFGLRRPPRKLKLTREGKYYLGITLGVGFAAINTGNNLLYLLLGMLLSLIVVSGVMSELSLRNLTVTRRLPLRAQVGRAHLVEIEVYNHKGRVPSYAIEVEDLRAGQPADKRCFFLKISPSSAQVAAYRRTPARRGRDHHTGFRIATRFPFGLFEKSREVMSVGDLIIYPAVDPVRLPIDVGGRAGISGRIIGRGNGDDIYTVRPMRDGDDPRDIYWRKSAAQLAQRRLTNGHNPAAPPAPSELVLRERVREARPDVELVLDVVRPPDAPDDFSMGFERRVRDVASRAVAHIKRGDTVVVRSTGGQRVVADKNVGADPILRFLALVDTVSRDEALATTSRTLPHPAKPAPTRGDSGASAHAAPRSDPARPPRSDASPS